ncbi:MAG: hypothetical protein MSC30_00075 [Gaiellaceae bacterium MAG52_C11]|nr:hypothetical protein [Candidatus Gaiellasilicea maunaloa]
MSSAQYESIEQTLLLLSEARERAEGAAREIAEAGGPEHLVAALSATDQELLALHRRLLDDAYFRSAATETQLALDAA